MANYHLSKSGKVGYCRAKTHCPLGNFSERGIVREMSNGYQSLVEANKEDKEVDYSSYNKNELRGMYQMLVKDKRLNPEYRQKILAESDELLLRSGLTRANNEGVYRKSSTYFREQASQVSPYSVRAEKSEELKELIRKEHPEIVDKFIPKTLHMEIDNEGKIEIVDTKMGKKRAKAIQPILDNFAKNNPEFVANRMESDRLRKKAREYADNPELDEKFYTEKYTQLNEDITEIQKTPLLQKQIADIEVAHSYKVAEEKGITNFVKRKVSQDELSTDENGNINNLYVKGIPLYPNENNVYGGKIFESIPLRVKQIKGVTIVCEDSFGNECKLNNVDYGTYKAMKNREPVDYSIVVTEKNGNSYSGDTDVMTVIDYID